MSESTRPLFVSRHPGAIAWARMQGIDFDLRWHLLPEEIVPGLCVVGTLPVPLAAAVVEAGGRYFHLCLHVAAADRGRELTLGEMLQRQPELREYRLEPLATSLPPALLATTRP